MPHGITQCYLPPGRGDVPALRGSNALPHGLDSMRSHWIRCVCGSNAVPHGLDPLAAEYTEHDHERVEKVTEVPQRHDALLREPVERVVGTEQLSTQTTTSSSARDNVRNNL